MTHTRHEPMALLTVQEAAKMLHVSDDTVRRQIKEGDLEAVRIGTTPQGRPRYRIPSAAVEEKLGQSTLKAPSALERLQEAFRTLTEEQQETLIAQAVQWARSQSPAEQTRDRKPEPSKAELEKRFAGRLKARNQAS